jgi:hypothetical protein
MRSRFLPFQTVSSFSWMRSFATPPKTMPPSRPLPMGSASFHPRGCVYQSSIERAIGGGAGGHNSGHEQEQ